MNIIKACAGLQLQIFQVNMYSISNSLSGRAMSQSNNTEKGQENIDQAGEWIGGKPQGSLKIDKNKIILKINKKTQKVLISDFPSLTDAEIYSRNLLLSLCKQNGKISNEYRYHFSGSDSFLEVKVGETIIKVDVQSKEIIDKYEWLMNETDKSVYRKEGRVKVKLENELTGQVHEKTIFSKIDGNLFNFRLENLKKLTENDEKGKK
jgi:hypothetical protein